MKNLNRIIFWALIFCTLIFAENKKVALNKINEKNHLFMSASRKFDISVKYFKAIVLTERALNYDWFDEALDYPVALKGYNSSLGFCQIKLKTAYFVEKVLSDSTSDFYPGHKFRGILKISKSPNILIKKLQNDSLNILYAAAYLRIIINFWDKAGFSIINKPEIIGTLYSTGLFLPNGRIRKPNSTPKPNYFGKFVIENLKYFKHSKRK